MRELMIAARRRREELGRTQLDVASSIGVAQSALCAWENGGRVPLLTHFVNLIAELGGRATITFEEAP